MWVYVAAATALESALPVGGGVGLAFALAAGVVITLLRIAHNRFSAKEFDQPREDRGDVLGLC